MATTRHAGYVGLLTFLLLSIFFNGLVLGWALSSFPSRLGSLADWVAAGGTIAIGVAAVRYSRSSYQDMARRERRDTRAAYSGMIAKLYMCRTATAVWGPLRRNAGLGLAELRNNLVVTQAVLSKITWTDDERRLLDDDGVWKLALVSHELLAIEHVASAMLTALDAAQNVNAADIQERTRAFAYQCIRLARQSNALRARVATMRDRGILLDVPGRGYVH